MGIFGEVSSSQATKFLNDIDSRILAAATARSAIESQEGSTFHLNGGVSVELIKTNDVVSAHVTVPPLNGAVYTDGQDLYINQFTVGERKVSTMGIVRSTPHGREVFLGSDAALDACHVIKMAIGRSGVGLRRSRA